MKKALLALLFFISFNGYCQEWWLDRINKKAKFKYQYCFQFNNEEDTSSYKMDKKTGREKSKILIIDNKGIALGFIYIKITKLSDNSTINLLTKMDGSEEFELKSGTYKIEINNLGFDKYTLTITILDNEFIEMKVKLGLGHELAIYEIHCKGKLEEAEILKIMECVKTNRWEYRNKCFIKDKYYVIMQI